MKRSILLLLCILTALAAGLAAPALATTVLLHPGYAQVTNVETCELYLFPDPDTPEWVPGGWIYENDAPYINGSIDSGVYRFDIIPGRPVTVGQQDAFFSSPPAMTARYMGITFDWETDWPDTMAADYLRLEIWGRRYDDYTFQYSHDLLGVIPYGSGTRTGYADFWFGQAYNAYDLHLTVGPIVPEPSGLLALACGFSGFAGLALRRRK